MNSKIKVVADNINNIHVLSSLLQRSVCYFNTIKYINNNWSMIISMLNHSGERHLTELRICDVYNYKMKERSDVMCFMNAITTMKDSVILHTGFDSIRFYVKSHHLELIIDEDVLV